METQETADCVDRARIARMLFLIICVAIYGAICGHLRHLRLMVDKQGCVSALERDPDQH
jgi:hypothetical protein